MKHHTGTRIVHVAIPLLFGMVQASLAAAQVRPIMRDTMMTRTGTMPMANGTAAMMTGPHHALAMAYGESLATFARAVHADASRSHTVNVDLARPATIEMRRSFDQMTVHHMAQMAHPASAGMAMRMPMSADSAAGMMRSVPRDTMRMPMHHDAPRMGDMQAHMASIETHLKMLETDVNAPTPSATKVIEHTAEILKMCAAAMQMPSNAGMNARRRPGNR